MNNIKNFGVFEGKTTRKKQIQEEIKKKETELKKLETGEREGIIPLKDYTDEDKIKYFDKLYKVCIGIIEDLEEEGYSKDHDHWIFEEGIQILNIKNSNEFWKYYNSINK